MATHETALGTTVRAWRDRLTPATAGLPVGRSRRASGLRREELAELAGISVDYVVRLEQSRSTTPSVQVVAALARALQLTEAERDHLYRLAGLAPPTADEISDHILPGLRRVLNRLGDGAATAVFAADWQLITWNRNWAALVGDPMSKPVKLRNFARDTFSTDGEGPHLSHWPVTSLSRGTVESAVASDLRRATGRYPKSRRLNGLIQELTTGNERFAELWSSGEVGAHREDRKVIEHPSVGPLTVDCDVMSDGDADHKIVILTAVPDTEDETRLKLPF
ncbi:MAG: helix-turn-helix transcriptional regulator [Actinomycetia bacterium]|nr:helix-turn-helix transcriptional regulator [Actinomycetes bacterium]